MKNYLIATIIFVCCLMAGCANKTGVPVEFSKACSPEYDGKYIEVGGFLDDKGSVFCSNIGGGGVKCGFKFKEDQASAKDMSADIPVGSGANSVDQPPKGYKREDIKIRDDQGSVINIAEKVKLTGKLTVVPNSDRCFMTVTKIEK